MKTIICNLRLQVVLLFLVAVVFTVYAQENDSTLQQNNPKENITVNKKYDNQGDLIQYDSIYTWESSNFSSDSIDVQNFFDELPQLFKTQMREFINPEEFRKDSYFDDEFFHDDFFEQKFREQDSEMLKIMQQMDSLKMDFFRK